MTNRSYLLVSGTIFALVAVVHLARLVAGWELILGDWSAPHWASVLGVVIPGYLAAMALRLARS